VHGHGNILYVQKPCGQFQGVCPLDLGFCIGPQRAGQHFQQFAQGGWVLRGVECQAQFSAQGQEGALVQLKGVVHDPSGLLALDATETARVDEQVKQGLDALRIRCRSTSGCLDLVNGNAAPEGGEKGS
tara:strand:+ start:519 stop:905 length:387 start_codon:yes stop_codon:yes gene_type:complete